MSTYPLGWQSWSPPSPNLFRFPLRDYCPIPEISRPALSHHLRWIPIHYWCSWYALGGNINYNNLFTQAKLIRQYDLNITHFLIDDGWTFSSWLKSLINDLKALNFKIGLWYSPFTRHRNLPLYPTLDKLVKEYQLDFLKLDFLFEPYFRRGLKDDAIPHQTLLELFTYLHTNYPNLVTIACGCPFAPALGQVTAIRISKDSTFPPPIPTWIRWLLYHSRMRLLTQKYALIPEDFATLPDPDVRMFTLDNKTTNHIWDTIHSACRGLGDDLTKLSPTQINQIKIWLS